MAVCELDGVDDCNEELVLVREELAVPLELGEDVPVVDEELDDVAALDELNDVTALVMLALPDGNCVGAGDALRRLAMLRPRKVMEDTAASASPDSHSVDS